MTAPVGVEPDGTHGLPVSCRATALAVGMDLLGLLIDSGTQREDCDVLVGMALCRSDEADTTVSVLGVVPGHEPGNPLARFLEVDEAFGGASP